MWSKDFSFEDDGSLNEIPICFNWEDEKWQEKFVKELGPSRSKQHSCGEWDQEENQDESDVEVCWWSISRTTAYVLNQDIQQGFEYYWRSESLPSEQGACNQSQLNDRIYKPNYKPLL